MHDGYTNIIKFPTFVKITDVCNVKKCLTANSKQGAAWQYSFAIIAKKRYAFKI